MGLFSRKRPTGVRVALVFDIGSASVGGALALFKKGQSPKVLYATRRTMLFQKELNFKRFTQSMLSTLAEVSADLEKNALSHLTFTKRGDRHIDSILISYASPWYISQVRMFEVKKEKQFEITEEFIEGLIQQEEKEILKNQQEEKSEKSNRDIHSMEQQVIDIRLEGYKVANPIGKKTDEASVTVALTMISKALQDRINNQLKKVFVVEDIYHHSFSLAGFTVLRDLDSTPNDFLFMDVSGEVTDISVVKDETLLETVSFTYGKHTVIRKLSEALSLSPSEATSKLRLYLERAEHDDSALSFDIQLSALEQSWQDAFSRALSGLTNSVTVPHVVYLSADQDMADLFARFIEQDRKQEDITTASSFTVKQVQPALFKDMVDFRGGSEKDPFLALAVIYFNRLLK